VTAALWIDAANGAAGDMLLGALIDAGAPQAALERSFAALSSAAGEQVSLQVSAVRRHGLKATLATVVTAPSRTRRTLPDVLAVLAGADLGPAVTGFAARVFGLLADAEGQVHGVPAAEVHFHEVGALDALADVSGCAVALDALGLLGPDAAVTVSPVGVGSGTVRAAHGRLPVPVPAVVRILADARAPVSAGPGTGELCTPTGAALLAVLAGGWGDLPPMTLRASGYGAGSRDPDDHANLVRVLIGDRAQQSRSWQSSSMMMIETTVDDLDPRLWPGALDAIHAAGAADCWLTPALMRHGRPGHVLSALAAAQTADSVVRAVATFTTTLGVRLYATERRALPRDQVQVEVAGEPVSVKRGILDGEFVVLQTEFADAQEAARRTGLPVGEIIDRAREQARAISVAPGRDGSLSPGPGPA
jgi:pyridinium-3,5-bisthiocarboxylic acid mononucleotide nickel chelatase